MSLVLPQPGQVIRYSYLWWNEARRGRTEGAKDRPRGVVLTRRSDAGTTLVYVLPITHTPPQCVFRACRAGISLDAGRDFATMPVQDFTACPSRLTRVRELCRRWRSASRVGREGGAQRGGTGCCIFLQLSIPISIGPPLLGAEGEAQSAEGRSPRRACGVTAHRSL